MSKTTPTQTVPHAAIVAAMMPLIELARNLPAGQWTPYIHGIIGAVPDDAGITVPEVLDTVDNLPDGFAEQVATELAHRAAPRDGATEFVARITAPYEKDGKRKNGTTYTSIIKSCIEVEGGEFSYNAQWLSPSLLRVILQPARVKALLALIPDCEAKTAAFKAAQGK